VGSGRRLVGSAGNAPGRRFQFSFVTPDLQSGNWITSQLQIKLASRPGAAPGELSFGDSAAQAGARLVRIGAAAGSCARTSSVAGRHSAVKSQPQEVNGPGASSL